MGYKTAGGVSSKEFNLVKNDLVYNYFYDAIDEGRGILTLPDTIIDEYEDESGVNTGASENLTYDDTDDFYYLTPGLADNNYKLLCHFNGTDGSTTTSDSSPSAHTLTPVGQTQLDTAQSKFGTASSLHDGTGDYWAIPDSDDFNLGSSNFTIDFWIRFNVLPSSGAFAAPITQRINGANQWRIYVLNTSGTYSWHLNAATGGVTVVNITQDSPGLSTGVWYHIAVVRSGNNFYIFQNGVQVGTTQVESNPMPDIGASVTIGAVDATSSGAVNGWIDEFRILKGTAVWTSDFTPPTEEYDPVLPQQDGFTLLSEIFTQETVPNNVYAILLVEDDGSTVFNTDFKLFVSRDGGTTFTEAVLALKGTFDSTRKIYIAEISIGSQPSDLDFVYKITTENGVDPRVHASAILLT